MTTRLPSSKTIAAIKYGDIMALMKRLPKMMGIKPHPSGRLFFFKGINKLFDKLSHRLSSPISYSLQFI
jgi:hypothetical protein